MLCKKRIVNLLIIRSLFCVVLRQFFFPFDRVAVRALGERELRILGLWVIKFVDVGAHMDFFFLIGVVDLILVFLHNLSLIPVELHQFVTSKALEVNGIGAAENVLASEEGFCEEVDGGNLSFDLQLAVLPATLMRRDLDECTIAKAIVRSLRLIHALLLHLNQRMTSNALFRAPSRLVFLTPCPPVEIDDKSRILLLSFCNFLVSLISESSTILTLSVPVSPSFHQTNALPFRNRSHYIGELISVFHFLFRFSHGALLLA